jgi:hypothetical protein
MATAQNIITDRFRYYNSTNFFNAISLGKEYIYFFLARCNTWNDNDDPYSPIMEDSHQLQLQSWDEILAISRLLPGDCFRVIQSEGTRIVDNVETSWSTVWESGTIYDQYDDSVSMKNKNFYIISDHKVYKCLSNNGGASSTIVPSDNYQSQDTGIIQSSDNYIWKYMYQIPSQWNRWNLSGWAPVMDIQKKSDNPSQWDVMNNAVDGGVYSFRYLDGFSVGDNLDVILTGNGVGFKGRTLTNKIIIPDVLGYSPGTGYSKVTKIEVNGVETELAEAIISPFGGHGFNAVRELNGHFVAVGSDFNSSVISYETLFQDNNYRKIGVMSDVVRKVTSKGDKNYTDRLVDDEIDRGERMTRMVGDNRVQIFIYGVNNNSSENLSQILKDQKDLRITQGTAKGSLVNITDSDIHIITDNYPLEFTKDGGNLNVLDESGTLVGQIIINTSKDFVEEDCIRYSGNVLYAENLTEPRFRSGATQVDKAKLVLEF